MKLCFLIPLLSGLSSSQEWNYKLNGDDWPELNLVVNNCGNQNNQSPIDLKTSGWPTVSSKADKFNALNTDLENVEVTMNGKTSIVQIDSQLQSFYSRVGRDSYGGDTLFNGK